MNQFPCIAGHAIVDSDLASGWVHICIIDQPHAEFFPTLGLACDFARDHALTHAFLTSEYQTFCLENHLRLGEPADHLFDRALTDQQRLWLVEFIRRWESVTKFEEDFFDA